MLKFMHGFHRIQETFSSQKEIGMNLRSSDLYIPSVLMMSISLNSI